MNGIVYFTCRPKHGIFVRANKLIQDKRGRGMRSYKAAEAAAANAKSRRKEIYFIKYQMNFKLFF
jgi:kinesin family member 13